MNIRRTFEGQIDHLAALSEIQSSPVENLTHDMIRIIHANARNVLGDSGDTERACTLIRLIPENQWTEETRIIFQRTLERNPLDQIRSMLHKDQFDTAIELACRINAPRAFCIQCGYQLLARGYPREAIQMVQDFAKELPVQIGGSGLNIDVLVLYAKCARVDKHVMQEFISLIETLRANDSIPEEYVERLLYILRTGKKSHKNQEKKHFKLQESTKQKLQEVSETSAPKGLPPLDEQGKAQVQFIEYMQTGNIASASELIENHAKDPKVKRQYIRQITAHIESTPPNPGTYEELLSKTQERVTFVPLLVKKLIFGQKMKEAIDLFSRYHDDSLLIARRLGTALHMKRSTKYLAGFSEQVMRILSPEVAMEILKTNLFDKWKHGRQIAAPIARVFASCLALDIDLCRSFADYLRAIRPTQPVLEIAVLRSLENALGREHAKIILASLQFEDLDALCPIGNIARSNFFQEPHALLRAKPVDRTAALVAGKAAIREGK